MEQSYKEKSCTLDKNGEGNNLNGCPYPDELCTKCMYWIDNGIKAKKI